jgi:hypothetical protein
MPLRITNGIPIIPKAQAPESLAHGLAPLALGAALLAEGTGSLADSHELSIAPVIQKQSQWCWAACVEMVLTYYQRPAEQCAVVAAKLGIEGQPGTLVCGHDGQFALAACDHKTMDDVWRAFQIKSQALPNGDPLMQVPFETIKEEIDGHKRPLEIGLKWDPEHGDGGHAILVKGWTSVGGEDAVLVNDPLPSSRLGIIGHEGAITIEELKDAFGYGSWAFTWPGLEPE